MSNHDSKRYFWLKLKDDFFDDDAIEWLEEQPNGKEYVLFYLKLCLKSLKHDCCLIRTVGNMLIPYDAKKLGELTHTKEDTVIVALELLKRIGLVDLQENGALFMAKVSEMIGSETNAAARMRKAREKAKEVGRVNNVRPMLQNCSPEKEKEKELEIEKDKDKDKEKDGGCRSLYDNDIAKIHQLYEQNIAIGASAYEYNKLDSLIDDYTAEYVEHAIMEAAYHNKRSLSYVFGILKNWKRAGVPKPWEQKKYEPEDDYDPDNRANLWISG